MADFKSLFTHYCVLRGADMWVWVQYYLRGPATSTGDNLYGLIAPSTKNRWSKTLANCYNLNENYWLETAPWEHFDSRINFRLNVKATCSSISARRWSSMTDRTWLSTWRIKRHVLEIRFLKILSKPPADSSTAWLVAYISFGIKKVPKPNPQRKIWNQRHLLELGLGLALAASLKAQGKWWTPWVHVFHWSEDMNFPIGP